MSRVGIDTELMETSGATTRALRLAPPSPSSDTALLQAAGFTGIGITSSSDTGGGLHSAIIQAARPPA